MGGRDILLTGGRSISVSEPVLPSYSKLIKSADPEIIKYFPRGDNIKSLGQVEIENLTLVTGDRDNWCAKPKASYWGQPSHERASGDLKDWFNWSVLRLYGISDEEQEIANKILDQGVRDIEVSFTKSHSTPEGFVSVLSEVKPYPKVNITKVAAVEQLADSKYAKWFLGADHIFYISNRGNTLGSLSLKSG